MTRKSKREIERDLEDLDVVGGGDPSDAREGVSAPFVTYEGVGLDEDDVPDGWTVRTVTQGNGATYDVLERASAGGGDA